MADETLDVALRLTDQQYTSMVTKATAATQKLGIAQSLLTRNTAAMGSATHGASDSFGGFAGMANLALAELDSGIPILQDVVSVLKSVAFVAVGAGVALLGFAGYAMKSAADLEALKMGLATNSASAEDLERTLKRLQEVARLPGLGFEEAVRASVRLQAVGMDARLAERAIMAFGNALAAAGGSKEDLNGVIIALTQIASKTSISAEEINQIAERIPQIRAILKSAFGTSNTEEIQKMGLSPQAVILRLIDEAEKLPRAMEGPRTAFENFGDVATRFLRNIGEALNTVLIPSLKKLTDFLDIMEGQGVFKILASQVIDSLSHITAFRDVLQTVSEIGSSVGISAITDIFRYLGGSTDLGDGLIRGVTLVVAGIARLPQIIKGVVALVNSAAERMKNFVNSIIDAINAVLKLLTKGISVKYKTLLGEVEMGKIGGGGTLQAIDRVGEGDPLNFGPLNGALQGIAADAAGLKAWIESLGQSNNVGKDKSKGGFRDPDTNSPVVALLKDIAESVRPIRGVEDMLLGGGAAVRAKFNERNLAGWSGGSGANRHERVILEGIRGLLSDMVGSLGDSGFLGNASARG